MATPQQLFEEIKDLQKERKTVLAPFKEALAQNPIYSQLTEEMKAKRDERKIIQDEIAENIKLKKEALSYALLGKLRQDENLGIDDLQVEDKGKKYQPALSLIFKRV